MLQREPFASGRAAGREIAPAPKRGSLTHGVAGRLATAVAVLAQATTVKDEAVWEKAVPPGINLDGYINADNLKYQVDWYFRHGQIYEQRPVEEMVDNQFVDYAIGVLGRYR